MSFLSFLGQVVKVLFGYGGGLLSLFTGIMLMAQPNSGLLPWLFIGIAFVLAMFGVYSEKGL